MYMLSKISKMHNTLHQPIKSTLVYLMLLCIIGQSTTLKATAPTQQLDPTAHHDEQLADHLNSSAENLAQLNSQGIDLTETKLPQNLSGANFTDAKLPQDLSKHDLTHANLSKTDLTHVQLPQDLTGVNFTAAKLPKSLAGTKLTHANLTGQHFTATDFTNAQLDGAMLTHTTCDYQQYFQDNVKTKQLSGGVWYLNNLPKDLKSIAQVYPQCSQDTHKAELLQIACGLARLPYDDNIELEIKLEYWSCKLILFREKLGPLREQLVCSLTRGLAYDVREYCWQTNYPLHLEHLKGMQIAAQWCISTIATHLPEDLGQLIQHYLHLYLSAKSIVAKKAMINGLGAQAPSCHAHAFLSVLFPLM